ncbi:MAG: hypothetical protein HN904_06450, partial [Victivallales bacterium]|nr:hypothetical protein [Victivallales bacterium]
MVALRCLTAFILGCCLPLLADVSPCVNGGFERIGGWSLFRAKVVSREGGRCLRVTDGGSAQQSIPVSGGGTITVRLDLRSESVQPVAGKKGFAYAAAYQLDAAGEIVAFKDFVQRTGTLPWQVATHSVALDARTRTLSLRCGLFQATGTAWFDNWALGLGDGVPAVPEPVRTGKRRPRAAILADSTLPRSPGASSALVIAQILARQGIDSMLMPATQLAAPEELQVTAYDLLVLPDSPVFPAPARANVIRFLRTGGSLVALGGYPFERMLMPMAGTWIPQEDAHARRVDLALSAQHSLLVDGGFEKGSFGEGWRAGTQCRVVKEDTMAGAWCVRTELAPDGPKEAVFRAGVPVKGRAQYAAMASLRTRDIRARRGAGYAFVAVYQYDADGKLAAFKDFATQTGDAPWQERSYVFETEPETVRIEIKAGIYNATGTAWIDDIRL